MKHRKICTLRKGTRVAGAALLALSLAMPLVAKEKAKGAELLIRKKDGQAVRAELLAVKEGQLILMDSSTFSDVTCRIEDIRSLRIVRKARVLKGLGVGSLAGGVAGAGLGLLSGDDTGGFFRFTARDKALILGAGLGLIGAIVGGISGGLTGIDESVDLEGRSSQEIEMILRKLDLAARVPQRLVGGRPRLTPISRTDKGEEEKVSGARFNRFHLTCRPGYSRSQAAARYAGLFRAIGFGDTRPARDAGFFGFTLFTVPATKYPIVVEKRSISLDDVQLDYSITRKLAVGIGFSSLGESEIKGYRYIPLNKVDWMDVYTELYLNAALKGSIYYFMVSFMPLADGFIKKASFVLGAGAGWGRLNLAYGTSKELAEPSRPVDISRVALAVLGRVEFNYFLNRTLSLGINAEYRYAPVRVRSFELTGSYYDLDGNSQLIETPAVVEVPAHRMNAGGFRLGMSIGFHL